MDFELNLITHHGVGHVMNEESQTEEGKEPSGWVELLEELGAKVEETAFQGLFLFVYWVWTSETLDC